MKRTPHHLPSLATLALCAAITAASCAPNPYERAAPTPKTKAPVDDAVETAPEPEPDPPKHVDVPLSFSEYVALSPDGQFLAVGGASEDGAELKVLSTLTWRVVHDLKDAKGSVTALAFSPDSKTLAWASFHDNAVVLADMSSGKILHSLSVNTTVDSVAFSFDGQYLAAHAQDGTTRIWNTRRGQESATMSNKAAGLAFHPKAPLRVLVASEKDSGITLELLKAPSYELIKSHTAIGENPTDVHGSLLADGSTIAHCSSAEPGTVAFHSAPDLQPQTEAQLSEDTTCDILTPSAFGPYLMIASYGSNGMSVVRHGDNPEALWKKPLGVFAFHPDGQHILTSSDATGLIKIALLSGEQSKPLAPDTCAGSAMAITSDGARVILSCNKEVQIIDLEEGRITHSIR